MCRPCSQVRQIAEAASGHRYGATLNRGRNREKYQPDELVGQTIVVVANLKPAKLMGVESQGKVLAAGDKEVQELSTFSDYEIAPGMKVK